MANISAIIKNVRNIMRNEDQGISGDAQRLEQLGWMLFLKILDEKDQELELIRDNYTSVGVLGRSIPKASPATNCSPLSMTPTMVCSSHSKISSPPLLPNVRYSCARSLTGRTTT